MHEKQLEYVQNDFLRFAGIVRKFYGKGVHVVQVTIPLLRSCTIFSTDR